MSRLLEKDVGVQIEDLGKPRSDKRVWRIFGDESRSDYGRGKGKTHHGTIFRREWLSLIGPMIGFHYINRKVQTLVLLTNERCSVR